MFLHISEHTTVDDLRRGRRAAVVIIDQTTDTIRNKLSTLFQQITRRIARADGSTIFFLDGLSDNYDSFKDIQNLLSENLTKSVFEDLQKSNLRGWVFDMFIGDKNEWYF